MPAALTAALLTRVPAAFHGGINDVLLTGLALAVADWCRRHGRGAHAGHGSNGHGSRSAVLLDLEGHGREEVFADLDLSRTVGWFTSLFPVRLELGALDLEEALAGGAALGRALKSIKEQLRALPDKGLGYGLLRYLNAETAPQLAGLRRRRSASTIWAGVAGSRYGGLGALPGKKVCGLAAAIRRCRLAIASRSTRTRSMAPTARS